MCVQRERVTIGARCREKVSRVWEAKGRTRSCAATSSKSTEKSDGEDNCVIRMGLTGRYYLILHPLSPSLNKFTFGPQTKVKLILCHHGRATAPPKRHARSVRSRVHYNFRLQWILRCRIWHAGCSKIALAQVIDGFHSSRMEVTLKWDVKSLDGLITRYEGQFTVVRQPNNKIYCKINRLFSQFDRTPQTTRE